MPWHWLGKKSAAQWLSLAEECCKQGTLLLLLTGGEPLVRKDFREIYTGCRKMGLMISINSNGSLIQDDMLDFLAADPPSRVNIRYMARHQETYGALCGNPDAYFKTVRAIENLQSAGILVKLNFSVTPYNRQDAQAVIRFCQGARTAASCSQLYVPAGSGPVSTGRFAPIAFHRFQAAEEKVRYDRSRYLPRNELKERWTGLLSGNKVPDPDNECQELPTQKLRCRCGQQHVLGHLGSISFGPAA